MIERLSALQTFDNLPDGLKGIVDFVDGFDCGYARVAYLVDTRFECVGYLAQVHGSSHARAAFQRMQQSR